jgi:hypothetical protein
VYEALRNCWHDCETSEREQDSLVYCVLEAVELVYEALIATSV